MLAIAACKALYISCLLYINVLHTPLACTSSPQILRYQLTTSQGLDLARLSDKGQFAFVDGLSELFYSPPKAPTPSPSQAGAVPPRGLPIRPQPGAVPARSPQPIPESGNNSLYKPSTVTNVTQLHFSGNGTTALDGLEKDIATVIEKLNSTKGNGEDESEVVLIIDQPDLLLAATGPSRGIGATEMMEWVMGLQQVGFSYGWIEQGTSLTASLQHVHSTILTLSADSPLIHNVSDSAQKQATPLEIEHAAFAIGSAHRARTIMQLRNLETGAASDVSGVLRASKGGAWEGGQSKGQEGSWEEREVLYFIQRDGGVSVFGRGES